MRISRWSGCLRPELKDPATRSGCQRLRKPKSHPVAKCATKDGCTRFTLDSLKIFSTINEMRSASRAVRRERKGLALVPTMGALHEGHFSLVRAARPASDVVAVSIFVNPTQFGPNEDLAKYPRSFERDCEMLEREGVEFVFAPLVEEMYPAGAVTWVTVGELSGKLDGGSRPGHFRGVTTVVAKLFHIVEPDKAFSDRRMRRRWRSSGGWCAI